MKYHQRDPGGTGLSVFTWFGAITAIFFALAIPTQAAPVHHGVAAGLLLVTQTTQIDTNTNVEVTQPISINNFVVGAYNRADYNVRVGIGPEAAMDAERGVLMTSVAENGRDNFGTNVYSTSSFAPGGGGFRIVTWAGRGAAGGGFEYNVNVACAWFPFDRYHGGFAWNSTNLNGGVNDSFLGSTGLVLGTHLKSLGSGRFIVDLRSRGVDSRTSGVLLVNHAKDENNFALSKVNANDGTWTVYIKDNASGSATSFEQDPVAFAFIPKSNTDLVSGRFRGDGAIEAFSGSSPQFAVTPISTGRWELKIPKHSPGSGVLVISAEGGGSINQDNLVSYQPNAAGDGWIVESRDTPLYQLETPGLEPVASFAFVPAPTPGFKVTPTEGLLTTGQGGVDTFQVSLDSRPATNVVIPLASSEYSKGWPDPGSLVFRPTTWHIPQTVTVRGGTNSSIEAGSYEIRLLRAVSADPDYSLLDPPDVSAVFLPSRAVAVSPVDSQQELGLFTRLNATVTNSVSGKLTVKVYGREAFVPNPGRDFTLAILPDTQNYTAERYGGRKEMIISQVEWIIANREARNIVYVTQLGDLVNDGDIYNGAPNLVQWQNATNAMYRQESPVRTKLAWGIPYGVAVGNHEMEPIGNPTGTTTFYNRYFGIEHFNGRPYYGGHYGTNNNNHFDLFSAGGLDFIVLYFEYYDGGDPAAIAWANQVLKTNAHRRAIVVTHNMGNAQIPVTMSAQGLALYEGLKTNANLFMMLGGHVTGEGSRQDTFEGRTVYTFVQDYQGWENGGNGYMRLLEFSPSNNLVVAQTYSPWLNKYETDEDSEFFFPYNMQLEGSRSNSAPYTLLAQTSEVSPGETIECPWPGLEMNKAYEWYVTVTDGAGVEAVGPVWRFRTAATNSPPTVANVLLAVRGDGTTNLVLKAQDINGDPVSFETPVSPSRGLLQVIDAGQGIFSYTPARGFRGFDRFTFRANDGQATSAAATMNLNVFPAPDEDGNGLPDEWELAWGVTDPNADADGDGASNIEEYHANTNPTNAISLFRVLSARVGTNGMMDLTWFSTGGTRYRVEYLNGGTNGGAGGVFEEIVRPLEAEMDPNAVGQGSVMSFQDDVAGSGAATNTARYYRVKIVQ